MKNGKMRETQVSYYAILCNKTMEFTKVEFAKLPVGCKDKYSPCAAVYLYVCRFNFFSPLPHSIFIRTRTIINEKVINYRFRSRVFSSLFPMQTNAVPIETITEIRLEDSVYFMPMDTLLFSTEKSILIDEIGYKKTHPYTIILNLVLVYLTKRGVCGTNDQFRKIGRFRFALGHRKIQEQVNIYG